MIGFCRIRPSMHEGSKGEIDMSHVTTNLGKGARRGMTEGATFAFTNTTS